jgi:hypothetical protein
MHAKRRRPRSGSSGSHLTLRQRGLRENLILSFAKLEHAQRDAIFAKTHIIQRIT